MWGSSGSPTRPGKGAGAVSGRYCRVMPITSTYRVQLSGAFPFAAARAVVPYLADLGVSHLYASPILRARAGSAHGYDVVDPTQVSPELGGEAGLRDLVAALRVNGMGLVVDLVPNHMTTSNENP